MIDGNAVELGGGQFFIHPLPCRLTTVGHAVVDPVNAAVIRREHFCRIRWKEGDPVLVGMKLVQ